MNNYDVIKKAFNEVHVSDEIIEKVKTMDVKSAEAELKIISIRRRKHTVKIISCIAAVLLLCVLASNVILHMSDDRTWTGGVAGGVADTDKNTKLPSEEEFPGYNEIYRNPSFDNFEDKSDDTLDAEGNVISENGRIYLEVEEYNVLIDITGEISDGVCSGEFSDGEDEYHYEIELTDGAYKVKIVKTEK